MTAQQRLLDQVTRWQEVGTGKPSMGLLGSVCPPSERVMNEICEDGSPQSKFTLYLLKEWGYALNEGMAVTIGQKAQELFSGK